MPAPHLTLCTVLGATICAFLTACASPAPGPQEPYVPMTQAQVDKCDNEGGCIMISRNLLAKTLQKAYDAGKQAEGRDNRL